ncbi:MAG: transglutaminase TgpA family protein [Pseudomonadota bacterium]
MSQIELAAFQVSRRSVPWMLAAVVAALLPHVAHMPVWLTLVCVLCVVWRYGVHRGRMGYPSRRLQALFTVALLAGILLHYRTLAGHQAGTATLAAMFALKLLEMYKERDAYVVILIGYFVAATAFLFFFTLAMAVYVIGVALLFTAALVSINASLDAPRFEPLKRASLMLLQSIPIAILLFVVLPRIGPLWSLGLKPSDARTGISDEMSPGSVGKLAQSDALAFRADFDGPVPPSARLYWRGLTLGEFDGKTWRQGQDLERNPSLLWYPRDNRPPWAERLVANQVQAESTATDTTRSILKYEVVIEPTQRQWLFALTVPFTAEAQKDIALVFDHRLRARVPLKTLTRYPVVSVSGLARDPELPAWLLADSLRVPAGSNPQARQWALQQRAEVDTDLAFVNRVIAFFRDEGFSYTLTPPVLGAQAVDEFMFTTRRGFCEHYASTLTYLMRAAGIPARVVVGYQGGEVNSLSGTVQVRQYDAHAWTEIWLPGRGWVEFDPTAVVAPERIEQGSRATPGRAESLFEAGAFGVGVMGDTLRKLGDAVDFLNHGWNRWVLGFDDDAQQGFLRRWLGSLSPYRIGMLVLGVGVLVIGLLSLWMFRGTLFKRSDPVMVEYRRFCAVWSVRGHERRDNEGPYNYLARLQAAEPRRALELQRFVVLYVQIAYGGQPASRAALRKLRAARALAS